MDVLGVLQGNADRYKYDVDLVDDEDRRGICGEFSATRFADVASPLAGRTKSPRWALRATINPSRGALSVREPVRA
jgi:hypothetical protein